MIGGMNERLDDVELPGRRWFQFRDPAGNELGVWGAGNDARLAVPRKRPGRVAVGEEARLRDHTRVARLGNG